MRTSTLKSLWKEEDFLDVTIACDDDQVNAHKVILSAASPFFHNILKRNPHSHPLLYVKGTVKKDMLALLDFIYSGEAQVLQEDLDRFMALASTLQVKGLIGNRLEQQEEIVNKYEEIGEAIDRKDFQCLNNVEMENTDILLSVDIEAIKLEEKIEKENELVNFDEIFESGNQNNSLYSCNMCDYKSNKSTNVKRHTTAIHEGIRYQCDQCDYTASVIADVKKHKRNEHEYSSSTEVRICESIEENIVMKTERRKAFYKGLGNGTLKTSMADYDLELRALCVKTQNVWRCIKCSYNSRTKQHVKEHVERYVEGYSHKCENCDKIFSSRKSLRSHKTRIRHY